MRGSCFFLGLAVHVLLNLAGASSAVDAAARVARVDGSGQIEAPHEANAGMHQNLAISGSAASVVQSKLTRKLVRKSVDKESALPLEQDVDVESAQPNRSATLKLPSASPMHAMPGEKVFLKPKRTLPTNYSTIKGRWKKDFPENKFGCSTSWYDDNYAQGYPTCPIGSLEVHLGSEESLKAEKRYNEGTLNGVSCMTCTKFGDPLGTQVYIGKTFKSSCTNSEDMSKLENAFGVLVSDGAKIKFSDNGTLTVESDGDADNVTYKWTPGEFGRMAWTVYQDKMCGGLCNTRYVLVDEADDYSKEEEGSVWLTTTNYYETGEGSCEISFVPKSSSYRVCERTVLLTAVYTAGILWISLSGS